ncbi:hypothetical protein MKZ07_00415 [Paenibacillus sp. FSL P4-0338]|uniref:hypothetical protein n=1 Tax=unclassified Paenibacillus TaxID=185978 RepID=UPI0003E1F424|nr:hypothetical protein [Paenibacillus sp. FSL R7-269]ETT53486.1 hypothetical protein C162_07019 [Paenibacillus sp. FSL R7-269]
MLDYSETRFLMQELLVDIVGEEARELDLLLEIRYKGCELFWYVFMRFSEITINNQNIKGNDSMTSLGECTRA